MSALDEVVVDGGGTRWVDTALSPRALREIASSLAAAIGSVDAVWCWDEPDAAVLAALVADQLGVRVVRAQEDMGLLTVAAGEALAGDRIALVAPRWTTYRPAVTVRRLAESRGAEVIGGFSVLRAQTDDGSWVLEEQAS